MKPKITIVGLGPGYEEYLTVGCVKALENAEHLILRTEVHGIAAWLKKKNISYRSMDDWYQQVDDFDELNQKICTFLISTVKEKGEICYAVPGHGLMGDESVRVLIEWIKKEDIELVVLPGISQIDHVATILPDVELSNVRILYAIDRDKLIVDPRTPLLILEVDQQVKAAELKIQLLRHYPPDFMVDVILLKTELKTLSDDMKIPLYQLDQLSHYDHTICVYVPPVSMIELDRYDFQHLVEIMRILRNPKGCPWDREQTHKSLKQYLIEEAYETLEAIDEEDDDKIIGELGDVLLQVVFHACIGEETSDFTMEDVTTAICRKMIERHTHIFGNAKADTADDVMINWEAIKKKEKGLENHTQVLKDIPSNLPALMRSFKVGHKAALAGFVWENIEGANQKVEEELKEFIEAQASGNQEHQVEELGDLLFAVVNVARFCKVNPEMALIASTEKFITRFAYMEEQATKQGKKPEDMTLPEMDVFWKEAKKR